MTQEMDNSELTFPQFDVISDFSYHHFLSRKSFRSEGSSYLKAISKEWRILQENLPESIFVRVSETRSDLLHAAIIGDAGTPYHDALFFFDIALTPNYPNLHSNGTVCLSLLNTWMGWSSECWNPKMSTLLRVLLSIQSLVLSEKPFFNFPAAAYIGNAKISEYYNQDVFVLTCKTTINLIQNHPRNFEPLIKHHFRQRASSILATCDAYANGHVMIGFYGCDSAAPPSFKVLRSFQKNMEIVYAKLVVEFRQK